MTTLAPRRAGPKEWAGLAVLSLPTVLLGLDLTVLHLALPHVAADLQPSSTQLLWIIDAYGFLIAGLLITMGTLGDRIGRRKLLMIGALAFGVASVLAAYSTSAEMLILTRALLGIAGATLMPSTLALISNMFADVQQRAVAIGLWATMFGLGMAAGPLVGGVLLEHFWWGSAFLVAIPVVGILLVAAPILLPEYRAPQRGRFDLLSVALSLAAILPVIYGVKQVAKHGLEAGAVLAMVAGVVMAVAFVQRQRGLADPLLDVRLFTSRAFSAALGVLLVGLVGVGGIMLLITQYLQLVEEMSPLEAGAWMGPPALMMVVAAVTAPLLARRVRPGYVVAGAMVLSAVGYLALTQVSEDGDTGLVVGSFGLVYLGLGVIAALGTDLVVGASPPDKAGSAAAVSEMVQELGIAVGVATLGSLVTAIYRGRLDDRIPADVPADVHGAVEDSLAGAASVAERLPDGLLDQAKEAFTWGLNVASMVSAAGVLTLAVLSAVTLRQVGTIGAGQAEPDGAEAGAGEADAGEPGVTEAGVGESGVRDTSADSRLG